MDSSTTSDRQDAASGEGDAAALIAALEAGRARFLALVDAVRPDLHRYCARMTGSSADGEDVVQDTLARAYYQVADLDEMPALRPWLFRIAHNLAIDHHRRSVHRAAEPLDAALDVADSAEREPDALLARRQAVHLAIGSFLKLAPAQRACVILKDVLDHSLDEIAALLELSVPSVKSALHRGRAVLRELPASVARPPSPRRDFAPGLVQYARLFAPTTGTPFAPCSPKTCASISSRGARPRAGASSSATSRTTSASLACAWCRRASTAGKSSPCSPRQRPIDPPTSSRSRSTPVASRASATSATCPTSCRTPAFD